jgi:Na+-transporting NADH:ubiquinone oxidoreductase subunit NqrB
MCVLPLIMLLVGVGELIVTNINLILISPLYHLYHIYNLRLNDILWLVYGFHNPHIIDVTKLYIYMRKMNENLVLSSILLSLVILSTCNTLSAPLLAALL